MFAKVLSICLSVMLIGTTIFMVDFLFSIIKDKHKKRKEGK